MTPQGSAGIVRMGPRARIWSAVVASGALVAAMLMGVPATSATEQSVQLAPAAVVPTVTSVTPSSGSVAGDDSITINGLGFGAASLEVTEVSIGDDTIGTSGIEYVDDTTIKVTTPVRTGIDRTAGAELVTVKTNAGTSSQQVLYTYRPLLQTDNVQVGTAQSTDSAATLSAAGYVLLNSGDDTYAVASMRKPITRAAVQPFLVSGRWSAGTAEDSGAAYTYATDVYLNPSTTDAYGYESDERALRTSSASTWETTFDDTATYSDGDDTRTNVLLMTSDGNCASKPNGSTDDTSNYKDGYETFCSVFGPQIYSEPFFATQGQALSFSWAAVAEEDDYEIYAYLINVPSLDDTSTGIVDDSVSVVAHSMGRNAPWTTSSAVIDDTGYFMFRFVNGSYDATGGRALGSFMYVDPNVVVGLANAITFPNPGNQTSSFSAAVSADSGSAVTVTSSTTSVCTVGTPSASAVTVTRVVADDTEGTCILTASQGAVGLYAPAQPVTVSFQFVENTAPPTPDPVFPPSAPLNVAATPGNASARVTWSPPASQGSFPVGTYQVVGSPGGQGCLVSAPTLTCEVSGLTNGTTYTFTVRALNGAGWGPYSAPSAPVTPGGVTPAPDPQPVPGPIPPGDSVLQVNGVVDPNVEVDPNTDDNGLVVTGDGWSMNLDGLGPDGNPLSLGPNGALRLQSEREVATEGTGFLPNSDVNLYVDPPALVTGAARETGAVSAANTDGIFVGTVRTDAQGSFRGTATLPADIAPGEHVLQAVGLSPIGQSRALSLGVIVDPWIVLDQGTRGTEGRLDRIRTTGSTAGIEAGTRLTPWIRYSGQNGFQQGKATIRVQADGTFRWTRKIRANRSLTAYVSYTEIESNRVRWARVR